jgi:hypothetical protein
MTHQEMAHLLRDTIAEAEGFGSIDASTQIVDDLVHVFAVSRNAGPDRSELVCRDWTLEMMVPDDDVNTCGIVMQAEEPEGARQRDGGEEIVRNRDAEHLAIKLLPTSAFHP